MNQQGKEPAVCLTSRRNLLLALAVIFLAITLAMFLLPDLRLGKGGWIGGVLEDAGLLSILVMGVLWWVIVRPLRKAAVRETARSEASLRRAQRVAHTGSWEWEVEEGKTWWSDETYRIFGLAPQALTATYEGFLNFVHPDDREAVERSLEEALRSGESYIPLDFSIVRPDGSTRFAHSEGDVIRNSKGKPIRLIGTVQDITERKRAETAMRDREENFRRLIANLPDVTWSSDSNGHIQYISPNVEEVFGYTADELCEKGDELWMGRIHPADSERVIEAFQSLFSINQPFDVEYQIERKDGRWIWIRDRAFRTYEKDGVRCADGTFADVTERKRIEADNSLLAAAIAQAAESIVITDTKGIIQYVNPAFTLMTGYSAAEVHRPEPAHPQVRPAGPCLLHRPLADHPPGTSLAR